MYIYTVQDDKIIVSLHSLSKVEAISVNYGDIIMYNTPFVILREWQWKVHLVQHQDDGYWVRYLELFPDKRSSKHFHKAKLKLLMLCRLLMRKVAPPAAKKLVYSLCLKSQIRYPPGHHSSTMHLTAPLRNCSDTSMAFGAHTPQTSSTPQSNSVTLPILSRNLSFVHNIPRRQTLPTSVPALLNGAAEWTSPSGSYSRLTSSPACFC
jgi:hypothetical protein